MQSAAAEQFLGEWMMGENGEGHEFLEAGGFVVVGQRDHRRCCSS